jgi:hypothetical protein
MYSRMGGLGVGIGDEGDVCKRHTSKRLHHSDRPTKRVSKYGAFVKETIRHYPVRTYGVW